MFKKILVALDGSQPSQNALDAAIRLAEDYQADLLLFHVMQMPIPADKFESLSGKLGSLYYQLKEQIEGFAARLFQEATSKCASHSIKWQKRAVWGDPAGEIIKEACNGNYDLIVIGSRGLDDVENWLLGSVSQRVVRRSKCPVLVIR
ncbi:universal stress protein [Desulfallas thermosapovorans]|uniref:Nucleotide-binding universal stress UspA family protein n=1 Tax=Desulfallas thermosapovorans DSM 6562 TaxID=1121431 RepID=A0A5S4ZVT0_9FIRM|nr:universal stress protein [Desulfallas thermosapovorans]TYO96849.1 nucleotide-binding universal stress UspA family protein [Desulfallas thermosapovorans DSM 6562]